MNVLNASVKKIESFYIIQKKLRQFLGVGKLKEFRQNRLEDVEKLFRIIENK